MCNHVMNQRMCVEHGGEEMSNFKYDSWIVDPKQRSNVTLTFWGRRESEKPQDQNIIVLHKLLALMIDS